jgi:2-iminobutanoate/2-iminopropanoate deaminase
MLARNIAMCLVASTAAAAAFAADTTRQYVPASLAGANAPAPPFSNGVLAGGTFYVAGHIGIDASTQKAATNVDTEVHLMLDGVKKTLAAQGLTMDDLVSVTVYCTDLTLYDAFNGVYRGYFHEPYPARAFIGVNSLVRGAHFEIMGVALKSRAAGR